MFSPFIHVFQFVWDQDQDCAENLSLEIVIFWDLIADILLKVQILSFDLTVIKWLLYILFLSFSISYIFYF